MKRQYLNNEIKEKENFLPKVMGEVGKWERGDDQPKNEIGRGIN